MPALTPARSAARRRQAPKELPVPRDTARFLRDSEAHPVDDPGLEELRSRIRQRLRELGVPGQPLSARRGSLDAGCGANLFHELLKPPRPGKRPRRPDPASCRLIAQWLQQPEDEVLALAGHRSRLLHEPTSRDPLLIMQDAMLRAAVPRPKRDLILGILRLPDPQP